MGGLPWGGPRLPDIPQMACKTADFQPYGAIGGKTQGHQVFFRPDGQQFQHPVAQLERDLVVVDRIHLVENQRRMGPPISRLDRRVGLPAKTVQQENEALLAGEIGAVPHRYQRVLHRRRDHAEIVGVERRELQFVIHGNVSLSDARCRDRKSTRLNSSHLGISYAVFCLKKKKTKKIYFFSITKNTNKK